MLCLSLCLVGLSLHHRFQGATPEIIPLIMLFASLTLAAGFALALYRSKPSYQVGVVLLDGSRVTLLRKDRALALSLLDGLTAAMDWHRFAGIEIDAQRASHLRQGVAQGRQRRRWRVRPDNPRRRSKQSRTQSPKTSRKTSRRAGRRHPGKRSGRTRQAVSYWFSRIRGARSGKRTDTDSSTGHTEQDDQVKSKKASESSQSSEPNDSTARPQVPAQKRSTGERDSLTDKVAMSSHRETAAQTLGRQNAYRGAGPVVVMKQGTLPVRLKIMLARLKRLLGGRSGSA